MKHSKLIEKLKQSAPEILSQKYNILVSKKVRRRYTLDAELAILRQRDTKPEEFQYYNIYVEECKAEAKAELGMD